MRWRRVLTPALAIPLIAVGVLGLLFWLFADDMTADDRRLTGRILQAKERPISARDLYPGEWDYVCYMHPYSMPSDSLKRQLPETIADLKFVPGDRWVDEERWSLAFVTRRSAEARIFLIDNRSIYSIEGPACVTRESAAFRIETVAAPNKTYTRLTLAGEPR